MSQTELCQVKHFTVIREGVGQVRFHGETDCSEASLGVRLHELGKICRLRQGEVVVYPETCTKPPIGEGLNKPASLVLLGCMPPKAPNGDVAFPNAKSRNRYRQKIAEMTRRKGAVFVDYDCDTGVWKFDVDHF